MTRSWILGPLTVILLAGCGGGANNAGNPPGGAGTETGSPGMTSDTSAAAPAPGPADTAMTGADTSKGTSTDTGMAKTDTSK